MVILHTPGAQQDPQHDGHLQELGHFHIFRTKSLKIGLEEF